MPHPFPAAVESLTDELKHAALQMGFDLVGVAPAVTPLGFSRLKDWLACGFAGEMAYLPRRESAYEHPDHVLADVQSVVMVALNYKTCDPPDCGVNEGRIARYAWGANDYHDLLKQRLQQLADWLHERAPGCRTRCVVDTAPLLERDFAQLAGLGWFGKNTMLLNKRLGSFLFLGALLTNVELEPDEPHATAHCGACTRCLDVCPTDAFPEPYVLDARKCISYLTIELRGPMPAELRPGVGEWLFGCDLCQDVCPWNRKPPRSNDAGLQPQSDLAPADALALLQMTVPEFRARFRNSPLSRPGWSGLRRNAAIVLGNRGDAAAEPALCIALRDDDPVVRGAAAWALGQLATPTAVAALQSRRTVEDNPEVIAELDAALSCAC
jgi:epoxyqueuosine reductase